MASVLPLKSFDRKKNFRLEWHLFFIFLCPFMFKTSLAFLSNAVDDAAGMTRRSMPDRKVHHLLQLVHKHTLSSWSQICRQHTDKVTIKRYWNKINGDGGGGRPRGCVLQERKRHCAGLDLQHKHAQYACVHINTQTHTYTPPISPPEQGPTVPLDATSARKI